MSQGPLPPGGPATPLHRPRRHVDVDHQLPGVEHEPPRGLDELDLYTAQEQSLTALDKPSRRDKVLALGQDEQQKLGPNRTCQIREDPQAASPP